MWEISNTNQVITAALAIGMGAVFSLLYDVLKAFRISFIGGKLRTFFEDIIYSLLCTFFTFCLLILRTKGQVRGYVLISLAVGFLISRLLFSKTVVTVFRFVIRVIYGIFRKISVAVSQITSKILSVTAKTLKKFAQTIKKGLKAIKRLVYNHRQKNAAENENNRMIP